MTRGTSITLGSVFALLLAGPGFAQPALGPDLGTPTGIVPVAAEQTALPPGVLPPAPLVPSAPPAQPPQTTPTPGVECPICPPLQEPESFGKPLTDSLHQGPDKGLFDSLHPRERTGHWYDTFQIRGYTQVRFGRTLDRNEVKPQLLGDRAINGETEDFSIRRMRMIFFGDLGKHASFYIQPDFASTVSGQETNTFFAQLRDAYADIYIDTDRVNRLRVGLSKVPFGWENLQSSQNRLALDRTEPINIGVNPNERDLGVFYYWTPVETTQLFKELVDGGLKGSGNYGVFAFGAYNGQGGAQFEANRNLHVVSRLTYPVRLPSGQVIEASIQGYYGEYVVQGTELDGPGGEYIPLGTAQGGNEKGLMDRKAAVSFIYYPQPFGFQTEWSVGNGPGLSPDRSEVVVRANYGGYAQMMYKVDMGKDAGIFTPFVRYEYFKGGYRSQPNAPFGTAQLWQLGIEWQPWRAVEVVCEYTFANRINTSASSDYEQFVGNILRVQCQFNY